MATISVATTDVLCFDLYLINIFAKPTKTKRCKHIMFKLTLYCLFVNAEDLKDIDMKIKIF